jgi:glycosyltransferase involved in cell wall biosynthesis
MHILYIITRANRGGAQTNLLALATAAQQAGHTVSVITGEVGWLTRELERHGIKAEQLPGLRRSWNPLAALAFLGALRLWLQRHRVDVLHCHSSNTMPAVWAVLSLPLADRPHTVFTVHGWSALSPGWGMVTSRWLYRQSVKLFLPRFDRLILVSQADLDLAHDQALLPANRCRLVLNGISQDRFLRSAAEARQVLFALLNEPDRGQTIVGTIARLDYQKNLGLLVAAAKQVDDPDTLYIIGGDGPERTALRQQITAMGLENQVRLIGPVIDPGDFLRAFDLFVMPSRFEGLPYTLLEAGLAGLPVLATRVGGNPEIVEPDITGRLVPEGDLEAFVGGLRWFLKNRETAARYGQALRDRVLDRFSEDKMAAATLALYATADSTE